MFYPAPICLNSITAFPLSLYVALKLLKLFYVVKPELDCSLVWFCSFSSFLAISTCLRSVSSMNYWCLEEEKPSLIYPSSIWSMEGSFNSSLCSVWLYLCLFYLRELYAYFFGSFTSVVAYISAFDVCFMISRAVSSAANSF